MSMHMFIIIRASMYMYWPGLLFRVQVPGTITINIRCCGRVLLLGYVLFCRRK